jgi:hypothetical protein
MKNKTKCNAFLFSGLSQHAGNYWMIPRELHLEVGAPGVLSATSMVSKVYATEKD